MNDNREEDYEEKLAGARTRMSNLALALQEHGGLAAIDTAGLLMGAAVGVLTTSYGSTKAAEYLFVLAQELAGSEDGIPRTHGHC